MEGPLTQSHPCMKSFEVYCWLRHNKEVSCVGGESSNNTALQQQYSACCNGRVDTHNTLPIPPRGIPAVPPDPTHGKLR
ncbi:hypothetical protein E2C01_067609 [Portunus trituberculatus]|uniref:Uncharacterized protein n=1 Tax=Portunus trituberculatus TaxID=210409 RepID=A0A5B7HU80_PORTR|nr:hypothetical protein [Portunus trituberculatus]